MEQDK